MRRRSPSSRPPSWGALLRPLQWKPCSSLLDVDVGVASLLGLPPEARNATHQPRGVNVLQHVTGMTDCFQPS
ncbi:hypothetical protein ACO7_630080 [Thiomonas arsenitoxydans]|nr:hypothetical protein ACO7_630080 [Thiomonas arsenitoxydans]